MKAAKRAVLFGLKAAGVFRLVRFLTRRRVRVLCYHNVWRAEDGFGGDSMFIRPETFAGRLSAMKRLGFPVVSLDVAVEGLAGRTPLPDAAVVVTIDDGWFGTYADMLPALARHQMPATLYCDTQSLEEGLPIAHVMARYLRRICCVDKVISPEAEAAYARACDLATGTGRPARLGRLAGLEDFARLVGIDLKPYLERRVFSYMTPEELRAARAAGLSVQLHTHRHSLHHFRPEEVEDEIRLNRGALSALLDRPEEEFRHFCYPSGLTAPGAVETLRALRVASATTLVDHLAGIGQDPLLMPRILDGDQLSDIEFEAELCGVGDLLRRVRAAVKGEPRPVAVDPEVAAQA